MRAGRGVRVAIVAVGTELVDLGRGDSNSEWLTAQLQRRGFEIAVRSQVADDVELIVGAVRHAASACSVVLITGGLGPTEDDRTREALARAAGRALETDPEERARLRGFFESRGRAYREVQDRQALRPRGSEWIANPLGTAAGIVQRIGGSTLFALPGVPAEMAAMFEESVAQRLPALAGRRLARRTLKVAGRTESSVDRQLHDLYGSRGLRVTLLTGGEGIEVHLLAVGDSVEQAQGRLDALDRRMRERLGRDLYGQDDETLPHVVGRRLDELGKTLATAESCTAGLLSGAVTTVPGSSAWYRGGMVVYHDELKSSLAGLEAALVQEHGAVSERVARAMASAARLRGGADYGLAVTGIAGPGGGSVDKPVGRVHVAIDGPAMVDHVRLQLIGDRELIRRRTVVAALDRLRRALP